jgi:hypothetical protein
MFPRGNFFLARLSVCITAGVSVGGWFFLFATELATEMGFTDDWFTDGESPSVLGSPTDFIAITDGINPSVKLDNVVVGGGIENMSMPNIIIYRIKENYFMPFKNPKAWIWL